LPSILQKQTGCFIFCQWSLWSFSPCRLRWDSLWGQWLIHQPWLSWHLPKQHSLRMGHHSSCWKDCHRQLFLY
jgi:hypothetical protein